MKMQTSVLNYFVVFGSLFILIMFPLYAELTIHKVPYLTLISTVILGIAYVNFDRVRDGDLPIVKIQQEEIKLSNMRVEKTEEFGDYTDFITEDYRKLKKKKVDRHTEIMNKLDEISKRFNGGKRNGRRIKKD